MTLKERRRSIVRYWEWRRMAFNAVLFPPAFVGWFLGGMASSIVGDPTRIELPGIALLFATYAAVANICFSYVYVFEIWFLGDDDDSFWPKRGRSLTFIGGTLVAIVLAFAGGRQIAFLEFNGP